MLGLLLVLVYSNINIIIIFVKLLTESTSFEDEKTNLFRFIFGRDKTNDSTVMENINRPLVSG